MAKKTAKPSAFQLWTVVKQPFEREIVRRVEYGVFAKNGNELIANVTSRKDALLIAAAPLMLEALETLTAVVGLTPIAANKAAVQEAFDQARAAIAAAKGE
jgi:hypothetical protein